MKLIYERWFLWRPIMSENPSSLGNLLENVKGGEYDIWLIVYCVAVLEFQRRLQAT